MKFNEQYEEPNENNLPRDPESLLKQKELGNLIKKITNKISETETGKINLVKAILSKKY